MKHLFGILLFLSIVIGSIATYKFLVVPAITEIPVIEVQERIASKPIVRSGDDANGVYAIANRKRGEITVYVDSPISSTGFDEMTATFSFYAISKGEPVMKLNMTSLPGSARRHGASPRRSFTYKAEWLSDLEPSSNLYLMHALSRSENVHVLAFSPENAVAVLMKND